MSRKRRGRGEGGIYQRGDGLWVASVSRGYGAQGRRVRQVVYGKTKLEVQEKLRQLDKAGVVVADAGKIRLADYLNRWLKSTQESRAPTTQKRYEQILQSHVIPHLGHVQLRKLTAVHIEQLFERHRTLGLSSRNRAMSSAVLHTALVHATKKKWITHNPMADVEQRPSHQCAEIVVWTADEAKQFLKAAANERYFALYAVAVGTGMRLGELFALTWRDIDFESLSVSVNKTVEDLSGKLRIKPPKTPRSRRRIDLPQFVVTALLEHRKRMLAEGHATAPVFCNLSGGLLRRSGFRRGSFLPLLKKAGVPSIKFHNLRHTAATLLLMEGVNPKVVSERLGHAKIATTLDTYSHVLPTMQRAAAEKLDRLLA